jgi:hypothetical protein
MREVGECERRKWWDMLPRGSARRAHGHDQGGGGQARVQGWRSRVDAQRVMLMRLGEIIKAGAMGFRGDGRLSVLTVLALNID